ncbi:protein of unknown function [Rhodovastum atsumiense]|nr:protein of unknown function [Rhodovastum atsumiense]
MPDQLHPPSGSDPRADQASRGDRFCRWTGDTPRTRSPASAPYRWESNRGAGMSPRFRYSDLADQKWGSLPPISSNHTPACILVHALVHVLVHGGAIGAT